MLTLPKHLLLPLILLVYSVLHKVSTKIIIRLKKVLIYGNKEHKIFIPPFHKGGLVGVVFFMFLPFLFSSLPPRWGKD